MITQRWCEEGGVRLRRNFRALTFSPFLAALIHRNGLNLDCLPSYPTFFGDYYYKLLSRIITFPLTTIAAINGHCFAGGLCLALACDWRICRASSRFPARKLLLMDCSHCSRIARGSA